MTFFRRVGRQDNQRSRLSPVVPRLAKGLVALWFNVQLKRKHDHLFKAHTLNIIFLLIHKSLTLDSKVINLSAPYEPPFNSEIL